MFFSYSNLTVYFNEMKVRWFFKCVRKPTKSRLGLTHHANKSSRWAEEKKNIKRSECPWNAIGKGKVYMEERISIRNICCYNIIIPLKRDLGSRNQTINF